MAICQSIIDGSLSDDFVAFDHKATVCTYITPEGYPDSKNQKGDIVTFPAIPENARIYYGDIAEAADGSLHLGGSRTAGIVGIGDTIGEAQKIAERLCAQVQGPVRYRKDIGTEELVGKRVEMMRQIRH